MSQPEREEYMKKKREELKEKMKKVREEKNKVVSISLYKQHVTFTRIAYL